MDISFQVDWDSRKGTWIAWAHQAVGHDWLEAHSAAGPTEALRALLDLIEAKVQ